MCIYHKMYTHIYSMPIYVLSMNWFSDTCIYVYIVIPIFISRFSLSCQPFFVCVKKWTNRRYSKIKRNIDFDSYNYSYNDWVWIMDLSGFEPLAYEVIESWLAIWEKKGIWLRHWKTPVPFNLRSAESLSFQSRGVWGAGGGVETLGFTPSSNLKLHLSGLSYRLDFWGRFH